MGWEHIDFEWFRVCVYGKKGEVKIFYGKRELIILFQGCQRKINKRMPINHRAGSRVDEFQSESHDINHKRPISQNYVRIHKTQTKQFN